ncbi:DUF305 domain-containing protein [Mycobacteriaceae bacterium 1482268.1]|nr:DUF305 domain-containing protein [Mycobacteriaceae bacterium 1482268.1]
MWKQAVLIGASATAVLVITVGCSSDSGTEPSAASSSPVSASAPAATEHNQADVMFSQHMIPHHQQAIEMSDIILAKQGVDSRVTDLATKIKAAQGPEISQMQDWLRQWGNPPMPPMTPSEGHGGHDMSGMSGGMAGMMSAEEMTALKNAQGVEASRLFLTGMIKHHQGAIDMAQTEIKDGQFGPAIELARSIATTQQQEIDTMKGILGTL